MLDIRKSWIESVNNRKSRRTYKDEDLRKEEILPLIDLIEEINKETSLNIQMIKDCKEGISGFKASYGMISGVSNFVALVGNKNIPNYKEKIGYYGEMIVLEATSLGLGTCWVGGTYDRRECEKHITMNSDEELLCIIVIGHIEQTLSIKEKLVASLNKKGKNFNDILITKNKEIPSWVERGIDYALKSPSALNKKPIGFKLEKDKIQAVITTSNHGYEDIDLGIAMLHFKLGAYMEKYDGKWRYEDDKYLFY